MKCGYMIKTVDKNLQGYDGFQYPKKGLVTAPDWNPKPVCGDGLHGLIHETKDHCIKDGDIWMVLKYIKGEEIIIGDNKIKVPRAWVVGYGTAGEMQALFKKRTDKPYVYGYAMKKAGDGSILTAGSWSTLTAGSWSTLTAGDGSTLTADNWSTLTAGDGSTLKVGNWSTLTAGNWSILTAGNWSILTAGDGSILTAGDGSTLTAGDGSVCTVYGDCEVQFEGEVTLVLIYNKHYVISKKWDGRKYKIYKRGNKIIEELVEEKK